ncbi:MAG: hypothetical protein ACD_7C00487G0001 [uncultured bacterium]|nr:MAG: hypothetical protein ACD_7C00487G0001 [uncultured bacterium]
MVDMGFDDFEEDMLLAGEKKETKKGDVTPVSEELRCAKQPKKDLYDPDDESTNFIGAR